jgi:alkanesulfonate monooxygenase SsuD/methylene tetrahydromethanopterin reductase-like flavin-dependent oxidoreductase (luciferase family)
MEIGMNLPVMAPGLDRDTFLAWCDRIDAGFFASLAAGERISFYNPDMTAALAAAAALTNRVKIVSGVFVPMLHHPVMLAKQLATIDVLSGGRFVAGLGVGGREQDYQSVDVPLGHRLTRLAKSVETMRSVWRGEPVVEGALPVGPAHHSRRGSQAPCRLADGRIDPSRIQVGRRIVRLQLRTVSCRDGAAVRSSQARVESAGPARAVARNGLLVRARPECARAQLDDYLERYLNFMAPVARRSVKQICIATTPQALRTAVQQAKDAGADDVLLVPTTSNPDDAAPGDGHPRLDSGSLHGVGAAAGEAERSCGTRVIAGETAFLLVGWAA